jgi:hypothetical protein
MHRLLVTLPARRQHTHALAEHTTPERRPDHDDCISRLVVYRITPTALHLRRSATPLTDTQKCLEMRPAVQVEASCAYLVFRYRYSRVHDSP